MSKNKNASSAEPSKKSFLKGLKIFFLVLLALMLLTFAVAGGVIIGVLAGIIGNTDLSVITNIQESLSLNMTSFIYTVDPDGNTQQLEVLYDEENRVWADLEEIPKDLQNAFIAIEDERFYSHKGFDIKRTVGAGINYIKQKITGSSESSYGGSTLTQQLIKNITDDDDYKLDRKIREIYRAYKLEQELEKDDILELYLNTIFLSQQCNGVKSAAKVYFNKNLDQLTLSECATIAAITQFPTKYDPRRNPENNKTRRNVILNKMFELGYITADRRDAAKSEDVITVSSDETDGYISTTTYYSDALIEQLISDLMIQKGYTRSIAEKVLYTGGLQIYAAMDTRIQSIMDEYYLNNDNFPKTSGDVMVQSAMVIIDPATGYVSGVVGGRGPKDSSRTLNRATQALRQPGSTIKPLAIYSPAIEYGKATPSSIVSDTPITIDGWSPRNDDRNFRGNITVSSALAGSRNVPAVRILQTVGLDRSFNFLQKNYHISSLVESRQNANGKTFTDKAFAAIGLGGLTDGVSVLEMAAAYVPFSTNGFYYTPSFYTKVLDYKGDIVMERIPVAEPAISESTAVAMTQMLRGVVTSGTGTSARLKNMPAAGKTGTTSSNNDRWFVGYTPYYVGAVWYGYDIPASLRGISGNPSARVWKGVMDQVHEGFEYKEFAQLGDTSHYLLCKDSGLLPNSTCTEFIFGDYTKSQAPKKRCDIHKETDEGSDSLKASNAAQNSNNGGIISDPVPDANNNTGETPDSGSNAELPDIYIPQTNGEGGVVTTPDQPAVSTPGDSGSLNSPVSGNPTPQQPQPNTPADPYALPPGV